MVRAADQPTSRPTGVPAGLGEGLVSGALLTDGERIEAYRRDEAAWVAAGDPVAVVLAGSSEDVQQTLRVASRSRVPVVPRGAGSGLSGGATAVDGCIVLALERMQRVVDLDSENMWIEVEPGVITAAVDDAARTVALCYPPDPSSREFCTIGGNVATNAGGLCCVKYGVTRDYVLGLEVVLADGTLITTGRRTAKGVTGYDLTALFVGSEGTLGVVTRARLRLRPLPPPAATVVAFFPSLAAAGRAVAELTAQRLVPSMLELMDRACIAAVDDWTRMGLDRDAAALLLARTDAPGAAVDVEADLIVTTFERCGATYVARSTTAEEAEQLTDARRLTYPALQRLGSTLLDDVAVPRSAVPALLEAIEEIGRQQQVRVATFGHAGDGNVHPTIVFDPADAAERASAGVAFGRILEAALELGGTVTGEHGVGLLKRSHAAQELGPGALGVHRSIKRALDPLGILNPGKAF